MKIGLYKNGACIDQIEGNLCGEYWQFQFSKEFVASQQDTIQVLVPSRATGWRGVIQDIANWLLRVAS